MPCSNAEWRPRVGFINGHKRGGRDGSCTVAPSRLQGGGVGGLAASHLGQSCENGSAALCGSEKATVGAAAAVGFATSVARRSAACATAAGTSVAASSLGSCIRTRLDGAAATNGAQVRGLGTAKINAHPSPSAAPPWFLRPRGPFDRDPAALWLSPLATVVVLRVRAVGGNAILMSFNALVLPRDLAVGAIGCKAQRGAAASVVDRASCIRRRVRHGNVTASGLGRRGLHAAAVSCANRGCMLRLACVRGQWLGSLVRVLVPHGMGNSLGLGACDVHRLVRAAAAAELHLRKRCGTTAILLVDLAVTCRRPSAVALLRARLQVRLVALDCVCLALPAVAAIGGPRPR